MDNTDIIITPPKNNIEGVKYPVALKIAEMLKNGRRYFGSSGASLTHQCFNPDYVEKGINPKLARIGLEGERDTTYVLKKWMEDKPNVVLCDSVHVRGWNPEEVVDEETGIIDGGDTDHVLIIGDQVFLIDTKRWKSKRTYTIADDGTVLRAKKPFPGGEVHMAGAMFKWFDYLDEDVSLRAMVVINSEEVSVYRDKNWWDAVKFKLLPIDKFVEYLDERWETLSDYDKTHINSTLVSQVAVSAVKPYDERKRVFSKEALSTFK